MKHQSSYQANSFYIRVVPIFTIEAIIRYNLLRVKQGKSATKELIL